MCECEFSCCSHPLDISQGERGCPFGKWLCIMSRWRITTPIRTDHLGPTAPANQADMSPPQAETPIFSPWGGQKCKLKLLFLKGFPLHVSIPKIPNQTVNLQWHFSAVTWRKITETKYHGKCDAFMRADGACTKPLCYNAIRVWLTVIKQNNHPLSCEETPCSNYGFCVSFKRLQSFRGTIWSSL